MDTLNRKILINSYPRSGSTTFLNAIRASVARMIPPYTRIFFHEDSWVCKAHIPIIFSGIYPKDTDIYTIIRNPLDAIVSNVYRWSNGYTGNVVNGNVVVNQNQVNSESELNHTLTSLIDHQIELYISYMSLYMDNHERIKSFTYEATQNRISECLDIVLSDIETIDYESGLQQVKNPPEPTSTKTDIYYAIKEYIENSPNLGKALDLYKIAKTKTII